MKVYEVVHDDSNEAPWHYGTQAEGHKAMKEAGKETWPGYSMTECEVQVDKEGVIALMNRRPIVKRGQSWSMSARGGLQLESPR